MNVNDNLIEEDPGWCWRNCRSLGVSLQFWAWPWRLEAWRNDDVYGGERGVSIGPFGIVLHYSIGNASDPGVGGWFALHETTAWERACALRARPAPEVRHG